MQAEALAAPFDAVTKERQQPEQGLLQILHWREPPIAAGFAVRAQPLLQRMCHHDPREQTTADSEIHPRNRMRRQPEQRPESCVAEYAERVRHWLAGTNGA